MSNFDPEKVVRFRSGDLGTNGILSVPASAYDALLDLYRKLAVSEANEKFLRVTDDAIADAQAQTIQRLEKKP